MKKNAVLVLALVCLFVLTGCRNSLQDVIGREPHFTGTVLEVHEGSLLVEADEGEDIRRSGDLVSVSLDIQYPDGKTAYHVGDRVTVYYNGDVAESYPLQVHHVYAVLLVEPADRERENVG